FLMSPQMSQTLGGFLVDDSKEFGKVNNFKLDGTYQYYSSVDPNHLESLSLTIKGKEVNIKLFGFVIRYFIILQQNYFGIFINFMTLKEFLDKHDPKRAEKSLNLLSEANKASVDPFEVYMTMIVEDGTIILPENLYNCNQSSTMHFHELQVDLRNLDVYMDMDVTFGPITWLLNTENTVKKSTLKSRSSRDQNLNVYAHRLYGPLPKTATYVCNWDINVGAISGQLKPSFLLSATSFGKAFGYHFVDDENALPAMYVVPLDPDVTFLNVNIKEIDISVRGRDSATQILLKEGLSIKFDDLANERFTSKVALNLPVIIVRSLALSSGPSFTSNFDYSTEPEIHPWVEVASLECSFDATLFRTTSGWKKRVEDQQTYIREQDQETLRVPFLYGSNANSQGDQFDSNGHHFGSLYVPPMPTPLPADTDAASVLYNESRNSSFVDISSNPKRKFHEFLGRNYDSDQEYDDLSTRVDDDSISITGSGLSISNTSFHTASDGDDLSDSDDSHETIRDTVIFSRDSDNGSDESEQERSPDIDAHQLMSSPISRSIPYGSYLRRYRVIHSKTFAASFASSFLGPPRMSFVSSKQKVDESEEKVTIVFETKRTIKVVLTPVFLKIIEEVLEAIKDETWDIEAMLDMMQRDHVGELTRKFLFKYTTTRFTASIPRVHLQFIQDVLLPDDLNTTNEEHPGVRTRYDPTDTTLCAVADLILDRCQISVMVKLVDENFKNKSDRTSPSFKLTESKLILDFDSLKLNVRFVTGSNSLGIFGIPESVHRFGETGVSTSDLLNNEPVVLDLSLDDLKLRWMGRTQPNHFSFDMDSFEGIFISQSAEILTGAIYWWLVFAEDLSNILKNFQKHHRQQLQYLIYSIAQYSDINSIESDPHYLTRPSHVLRLGAAKLKNDNGWKILGRVRHIKRLMERERLKRLQIALKTETRLFSMDRNEMYERVVRIFSRWRNWEMTNMSACRLFTELFQQPNTGSAQVNAVEEIYRFLVKSINIGHFHFGIIRISVWEGKQVNSVELGPIKVDLETRYQKDNLPSVEVTRPNTDPLTEAEPAQVSSVISGCLDVAFRIIIERIGVDVNPDMLAFAKHWLKVNRVFTSKFEALSSRKEPVGSREPSSPLSEVYKHRSTATITSLQDLKSSRDKRRKDEPISKFNIRDLLARINIFGQGIFVLRMIVVTASAHNLIAQTKLTNINFSTWFNNPKILHSVDKQDPEGVSVNKGSVHPGSRGSSGKNSNILIFSGFGGVEEVSVMIIEKMYTGSNTTLLSIELSRINTNVAIGSLIPGRPKSSDFHMELNVFLALQGIVVKLPQSLLKLYNFFEKWKTENLPSYDFLYKKLLDEWEEQRKMPTAVSLRAQEKNPNATKSSLSVKFQFLMKKFSLQSHMLPSLKFHYDAWEFLVHLEQNTTPLGGNLIKYSGQLAGQEVHFVTRQKNQTKQNEKASNIKLEDHQKEAAFPIPAIRTIGSVKPFEYRKFAVGNVKKTVNPLMPKHLKLESLVFLDFVKLSLNVNIIDNLLTAQSLLGSEISDALDVFLFSSKKMKELGTASKTMDLSPKEMDSSRTIEKEKLYYNLRISLRGLKISAVSPSAVGFFETKTLYGHITNVPVSDVPELTKLEWKFSAQNFSLSLNHNTGVKRQATGDDDIRRYRIAYIVIDLALQNFKNRGEKSNMSSKKISKKAMIRLNTLNRRLIDLYVYYSSELVRRKEMKAAEINKLAENTRKIWRSLNVEVPKYKSSNKSLLDEKVLSLEITRFAVALPLDLQEELLPTNDGSFANASQIPAFILSASSMNFITRKLESSRAVIKDLCLQFVKQFDQGNEEHFSSHSHQKINRISLPEISFEGNSSGAKEKKRVDIDSRVEGFEIDIGGDIVNHINSLGEIYAASRDRLETFTVEANLSLGSQHPQPKSPISSEIPDSQADTAISNAINLDLEIRFTAKSGTIKLYSKSHLAKNAKKVTSVKMSDKSKASSRGSRNSIARLNLDGTSNFISTNLDDMSREHGIDTIIIPGLSINTMYRTILGQPLSTRDSLTKRIHIELVIHPSSNTLYPSLVPFFKDIIDGLKIGVQRSSDKKAIADNESSSTIYGMNITCYFKLSRTTFELSCLPVSKVGCFLNWEEGNFLISSNSAELGGQSLTCVGKIKGASGNVRHAFSPEDCLKAETKNISFNATLMSRRTESVSDDSISIIVEFPQIMANLNIRHLQDLLLLKTTWFDQATKLYEESVLQSSRSVGIEYDRHASSSSSPVPTQEEETNVKPYSVYVLMRLKQLDLSSDLGQAIGRMRFNTQNIQVRTKNIPGMVKQLKASTDILDIHCDGRLIGYANMTGLTFSTLLGVPPRSTSDGPTCVTSLLFKTERIQSSLEYEYQKILVLEVDPMQFKLTDSWSITSPEKASVLVHADISLRRIQAIAAIKTIPIFLHMINRLLALIEEKRSSAASVISDSTQATTNLLHLPNTLALTPTSNENPHVSAGFNEFIVGGLSVHPVGKITIMMEKAQITIYPNHFHDTDYVQNRFDGFLVDMKRFIGDEEKIHRELDVQLNAIVLTKNSCKKLDIKDEQGLSFQQWFEHVEPSSSKNIFTLPSTHLIMNTEQGVGSTVVDHKFEVDFRGKLDVALNFGLIRYLQELAALYKEQLRKNAIGSDGDLPKSPVIPMTTNEGLPLESPVAQSLLSKEPAGGTTSGVENVEKDESSKVEIEYNPIVPVKLEPQLRYLGDATPPLEWAGVQRAKIPGLVHIGITMNLDEIINYITSESFKAAKTFL
ncbi:10421_t:CDS:10, partial [Acaulospora colombiana]